MNINTQVDSLKSVTKYLNMPTDVPQWKDVNRERRARMKVARKDVLDKTPAPANGGKKTGQPHL
jgi:hypothetical protein